MHWKTVDPCVTSRYPLRNQPLRGRQCKATTKPQRRVPSCASHALKISHFKNWKKSKKFLGVFTPKIFCGWPKNFRKFRIFGKISDFFFNSENFSVGTPKIFWRWPKKIRNFRIFGKISDFFEKNRKIFLGYPKNYLRVAKNIQKVFGVCQKFQEF